MSSPDPSPNGDPEQPDAFEMHLEPVDPAELNLDDAPMVEAAVPPRPGFGFWKALLWCLIFLLVTQIVPAVAAIFVLTFLKGPSRADFLEELLRTAGADQTSQLLVLLLPACGILVGLFVISRAFGSDWKRRIALRVPHGEHVVLVLLLIFPFLVFNIALQALLQYLFAKLNLKGLPDLESIIEGMRSWPWWVLVLGMSVGPAVSEELWCRGFLGQRLVARYGLFAGILATSFLFGLIHLIPLQAIAAALMGVVLHYVYVASRSILIPMVLHFLNNALALLAESRDLPVLIGKSLEHALQARPVLFLFAAATMAFAIGLAFYQSRVRLWTPAGTEPPRVLYPHVELPPESSANKALPGPLPASTVGLVVAATAFFAAVWLGW